MKPNSPVQVSRLLQLTTKQLHYFYANQTGYLNKCYYYFSYYLNNNPRYREYLVVYKFSTLNLKKTKFFQLKPIDKT